MEGSPNCASTAVHALRDDLTSFSDFAIVQSDIGNLITESGADQPFIHVAPNPASGKANIYFDSSLTENVIVHLTDLTGRIILSTGNIDTRGKEMMTLNLDGIAPGIYLLDAKSESHSALVKLIVKGE
jgi:hypothetical protein